MRPSSVRSVFIDGLAKTAIFQSDIQFAIASMFPSVRVHEILELDKGGFLIKGGNLFEILESSDLNKWKSCFAAVGKDIGNETLDIHLPGEGRRTLMSKFKNTIAFKRIPAVLSDEEIIIENLLILCKNSDKNIDQSFIEKSTSFLPKGQERHKTVIITLKEGNLLGMLTSTPIKFETAKEMVIYSTGPLNCG
jgi:hypothetical protein